MSDRAKKIKKIVKPRFCIYGDIFSLQQSASAWVDQGNIKTAKNKEPPSCENDVDIKRKFIGRVAILRSIEQ